MATKSRFIGVRFEPHQQRKLLELSKATDQPGNMSAALRWLVEHGPVADAQEKSNQTQNGVGRARQDTVTNAAL